MTRIDDRSVDERIPITLLTGFLGAGKTTLVNRLLSAPDAGKIAVIVNEFGEIGIDGDLIARANEDMLELTNGCICCAAQGDLMDGLNRLFLRKVGLAEPQVDFDKIVIETTGNRRSLAAGPALLHRHEARSHLPPRRGADGGRPETCDWPDCALAGGGEANRHCRQVDLQQARPGG